LYARQAAGRGCGAAPALAAPLQARLQHAQVGGHEQVEGVQLVEQRRRHRKQRRRAARCGALEAVELGLVGVGDAEHLVRRAGRAAGNQLDCQRVPKVVLRHAAQDADDQGPHAGAAAVVVQQQ
jgi:hypothetical protein